MKHFKIISFLIILFGVLITSCIKEKNFPSIPAITFSKYILYKTDSADCYINFKDGDGDIGVYSGDSTADNNLKMKFLYKASDGKFQSFDYILGNGIFDTLFYGFKLPNITPDGQYKALDGEIKIKLRASPLYGNFGKGDVVKFEITLTDRAGHKSNTVSTDEIVLP
jgi:hypothetical protein